MSKYRPQTDCYLERGEEEAHKKLNLNLPMQRGLGKLSKWNDGLLFRKRSQTWFHSLVSSLKACLFLPLAFFSNASSTSVPLQCDSIPILHLHGFCTWLYLQWAWVQSFIRSTNSSVRAVGSMGSVSRQSTTESLSWQGLWIRFLFLLALLTSVEQQKNTHHLQSCIFLCMNFSILKGL